MKKTSRKKAASRTPVTRDRALDAAMKLADSQGLAALTMRALAQALGVEAMSLYHHVANKEDILNGMVDRLFAEVDVPKALEWKEAMRQRAHAMRAALKRHRWAIGVLQSRKAPGAATLKHHDEVLGVLRGAGFDLELTGHAYAALDSYIYGFAQQEAALPFETGPETAELAAAMLAAFPQGAFPNMFEFMTGRVFSPGYAFANEFGFGLELILDGLERARAAAPGPNNG
jgi:AcrR family transcriptional regulator